MIAASIGESVACLVRVPTEVIKAKMQTNTTNASSLSNTFKLVLSEKSTIPGLQFTGGLYRGYSGCAPSAIISVVSLYRVACARSRAV